MSRLAACGLPALLLILIGGPVLIPVLALVDTSPATALTSEVPRIGGLLVTTLALGAGACLIAVPTGILAAVVLERIAFPGRRLVRSLVIIGLFIPLPVYAVAWQVVLGVWLPPLAMEPGQIAWRPWQQGLLPAAWVHGVAALPWVIWIVGAGLRTTDRGLEEDALLTGGPRTVLRQVVLPRAMLAAFAAMGWVIVQTSTEIAVTDAMMVRTFAEEVYTQFVGASEGLAAAVAVTLPVWLGSVILAVVLVRPVARIFGEPPSDTGEPISLRIGSRSRVGITVAIWCGVVMFTGLPFAALIGKAGGSDTANGWSVIAMFGECAKVAKSDGETLLGSVGTATVAGAITVTLAWLACVRAVGSPRFARWLFVLCVVVWMTPGPLVGLGLKDAIRWLVTAEYHVLDFIGIKLAFAPAESLLYNQPSPVPAIWATVVRLFPVAVAVLWPVVQAIPRELWDAARLDGLGFLARWQRMIVPFTVNAASRAWLAVSALAMGEISASKLVNPPGRDAYVLRLFDQMHYGAESTVAALCLVQLAAMALFGGIVLWIVSEPRT